MAISMLKIRRPLGRLIFNMGIAIPGKTVFLIEMAPGRRLNIKMLPYQYMNSHYKDKTVKQPPYPHDGNPYAWNYGLYIDAGP